ncbi:MAG: hypothetical protein AAFX81_08460 [Pseudomonadota bacterium]
MTVDDYIARRPVPARPSNQDVRAYLQNFAQSAPVGGFTFTQGAAERLARAGAEAIMCRPSIRERRVEIVVALHGLATIAESFADLDRDQLDDHARQRLSAGVVDAPTLKSVARHHLLPDVRPYGVALAGAAGIVAAAVDDQVADSGDLDLEPSPAEEHMTPTSDAEPDVASDDTVSRTSAASAPA